jgi:hypothetical protein
MNLDETGKEITPNVIPDISLIATVKTMDQGRWILNLEFRANFQS